MKSVIILLIVILSCIPTNFIVTALLQVRRNFISNTIIIASAIAIRPAEVAAAAAAINNDNADIGGTRVTTTPPPPPPTSTVSSIVSSTVSSTISSPLLSIESAAARLGVGRSSDSNSDDDDKNNNNEQPILLKVRLYPDPSLRKVASPVTKGFGSHELEIVVHYLINNMKSNTTAAIQYGIDARIIILKGDAASPTNSVNIFVNPNILSRSNEYSMIPWREYCSVIVTNMESDIVAAAENNNNNNNNNNNLSSSLDTTATTSSVGVVEVDLLRDDIIEIAAQDYITGRPIRKALRGESARAFQHEMDHLDGILIIDHAVTSLDDNVLPTYIANLERPYHTERQRRAFQRNTFQGNTPLYY
jgi:peptide deformylase